MKRKKFDYTLYADSELSKLFFRYLRYPRYPRYLANQLLSLFRLRKATFHNKVTRFSTIWIFQNI